MLARFRRLKEINLYFSVHIVASQIACKHIKLIPFISPIYGGFYFRLIDWLLDLWGNYFMDQKEIHLARVREACSYLH